MNFNKISGTSAGADYAVKQNNPDTFVGADLSRTSPIYRPSLDVALSEFICYYALSRPSPIMLINKLIWSSVGAYLSRTSPIYRPPQGFHDIPLFLLKFIVGHRWFHDMPLILLKFIYNERNPPPCDKESGCQPK